MSAHDRAHWDKIYQERAERPMPPPSPLLLEYTPPVNPEGIPPRALDFAAGWGQNGLWLAEQGYVVDIMDISRVALARARSEMIRRDLRSVNLLQVDADHMQLNEAVYDLVCVFRFLSREMLPQFAAAIKPGGRIIYETFNLQHLDVQPVFNVDHLVQGDELRHAFEPWRILMHQHTGHITQLVAIKPLK